jgi:hypothetical protein
MPRTIIIVKDMCGGITARVRPHKPEVKVS